MKLSNVDYNKYLKYKMKYESLLKDMYGGNRSSLINSSQKNSSLKQTSTNKNLQKNNFDETEFKTQFNKILDALNITEAEQQPLINKIINSIGNSNSVEIINNADKKIQELKKADEELIKFRQTIQNKLDNNEGIVELWNNTINEIATLQGLILLKKMDNIEKSNISQDDKCKAITTELLTAISNKTNVINNILKESLQTPLPPPPSRQNLLRQKTD